MLSNSISAFAQDDIGFVWIGTDNGLERFDGYNTSQFLPGELSKHSFISDRIESLQKDMRGNIWISSTRGAFLFNTKHETLNQVTESRVYTFLEYEFNDIWMVSPDGLILSDSLGNVKMRLTEKDGLSSRRISTLAKDKNGDLWVGTEKGLDMLHYKSNGSVHITSVLKHLHISFLSIDSFDHLWYASGNVLSRIDQKKLKEGNTSHSVVSNSIDISAIYSVGNTVWIGSKGNGIFKYTIKENNQDLGKEVFWIDRDNGNDLKNSITTFFEDNYSNIWVGTKDGMYMILRKEYSPFSQIKKDNQKEESIGHNTISGLYCDNKNQIWLATANGLDRFERTDHLNDKYKIFHFQNKIDVDNYIINNKIQSVVGVDDNTLMLSTKKQIFFFDTKQSRFYTDKSVTDTLSKYQMRFVRHFFTDKKKQNVYMAFASGSLACYNTDRKIITPILLPNNDTWGITQDDSGTLWVASGKDGVFTLSPQRGDNVNEKFDINSYNQKQFDNNYAVSIFCDHNNQIWIGTSGGLYLYTLDKKIIRYDLPYQDDNCYIEAIIQDLYNNIWVFGIKGVYKISATRETETIQYYEISNDDIARLYYVFGRCISKDGLIFSGGINGLVYFDPKMVNAVSYNNIPVISSFRIFNNVFNSSPERGFSNINTATHINLKHNDNQFSFELSSLYYPDPYKIKYAYKLDDYDKDWVYLSAGNRTVSFTNVPPGKYTLQVKATDTAGLWTGLTKKIHIHISSPWWNTWWSWSIYITLLLIVGYLVFRYVSASYKYRHQEEINQWKIRFFINLSHSFMAPLNMLQLPIRNIIDNFEKLPGDEIKGMLVTADRNVKKLHYLVTQLMEFRKVDLNKSQLNLSEIDIVAFIQNIYDAFDDTARKKNIHFNFETDLQEQKLLCDSEKIEIVIFNLLSNAFKYTQSGGEVTIKCMLDRRKNMVSISVIDTGQGIDTKELPFVFDRFRVIPTELSSSQRGQGVGLSLAKDFVEMHVSALSVKSELGAGSCFSFYLLLGNKHFKSITINNDIDIEASFTKQYIGIEDSDSYVQNKEDILDLPLVYMLDTDLEFSKFIKYSLSDSFGIRFFTDTKSLMKELNSLYPSLIISDIISEDQQEGVELCKKIKSIESAAHIPFILTSSMSETDLKVVAYEAGADAYIIKPYKISYLKVRLYQLLESQKRIKNRVKQELIVNPKEVDITSADDIFLANLMAKIEDNMNNESLTIDNLAESLNVSRSMLYRKICSISDLSPIDFVKNVRLKRAAQLLETESYTVAEVAFMVGFKDTGYFSTCFKKQFGISPKSYSLKRSKKS